MHAWPIHLDGLIPLLHPRPLPLIFISTFTRSVRCGEDKDGSLFSLELDITRLDRLLSCSALRFHYIRGRVVDNFTDHLSRLSSVNTSNLGGCVGRQVDPNRVLPFFYCMSDSPRTGYKVVRVSITFFKNGSITAHPASKWCNFSPAKKVGAWISQRKKNKL
jgi:hypothetical protein